MRNVPSLETVYRDYAEKGVKFFYIYKSLAHPERDGLIEPFTIGERIAHLKKAKKELQTDIPWIADNMSNDLKKAFGNRNNSEFVISKEGKILHARAWSSPSQLRNDLAELVGPIENPTTISDLNRKRQPRREKQTSSGVVDRVRPHAGARPLKLKQSKSEELFFVKLRASASPEVIENGSGTLHLGFHLDPIHDVHWNNLAPAITFELSAPKGMITPARGEGPKIKTESDIDPREFLVEVSDLDQNAPLTLKVRYFACSDKEGWCKEVNQSYEIQLEVDRQQGRTMGRGGRPGRGEFGRRGGQPPGRFLGPPSSREEMMIRRIMRQDQDGDGKVSSSEFAGDEFAFTFLDKNNNGFIEARGVKVGKLARLPKKYQISPLIG